MKLGLLLLVATTASMLAASAPPPEASATPVADACEADESLFRGGLRIPTAFASNPATATDDIEMSLEYFCACRDQVAQCRWRSSTALAGMN